MVTIASCNNLDQAQLLKARLAGSGIDAFIPDEFMAQNELPIFFASGGVRVQVATDDVEQARRVVADPGTGS
jgi:hypothetical protein